jgi:hypothetical protein
METYIIEQFDGKKCVGKEEIRTNDYDDVLKRVTEIVAKTDHRVEIWDSKAYRQGIRMRVGSYGAGLTVVGPALFLLAIDICITYN